VIRQDDSNSTDKTLRNYVRDVDYLIVDNSFDLISHCAIKMPRAGLEPARPFGSEDFKSSASAIPPPRL
jgi:hypothetical protein